MKRVFATVVNELWFHYNWLVHRHLAEDLIASSDQPWIPPLSLDDYGDF